MITDCEECDGIGGVEVEHIRPMSFTASWGDIYTTWETCSECGGTGEIEHDEEDEEDVD